MKPTEQTQAEADRAELVYTYVLSQIGAKTTTEVLALWQGVAAGQAAATASSWLGKAVASILSNRAQSLALGLAYFRLVRALRTGSTIANPLIDDEPDRVSLEMLRQEFEALVAETTGEGTTDITAGQEPSDDDDSVDVDRIDGLDAALEADEKASGPYVEQLLTDMAEAASAKVDAIGDNVPNSVAKERAKELHLQHGAMVAAAGARAAMNGGRNATNQASARDPKVIGWVRMSTTGTPCYFCAMLISRRVLYKSAFTAGKGQRDVGLPPFLGDGLFKFHDNCRCTAEPVYSDGGFATDPKYASNRYYADLWDKHIKGKSSGDEAINEWRKLLKRIRANNPKATQAVAA